LKLLLKQKLLAVYHDFYCLLIVTKLSTAKLHSRYVQGVGSGVGVGNFGKVGVGIGVGHFNCDSTTLLVTHSSTR